MFQKIMMSVFSGSVLILGGICCNGCTDTAWDNLRAGRNTQTCHLTHNEKMEQSFLILSQQFNEDDVDEFYNWYHAVKFYFANAEEYDINVDIVIASDVPILQESARKINFNLPEIKSKIDIEAVDDYIIAEAETFKAKSVK